MLDTQKQQKYYISYYDAFDMDWLGWEYVEEYHPEWIFTDINEANVCCGKLNEALAFGNVQCGEYYEVKQVLINP